MVTGKVGCNSYEELKSLLFDINYTFFLNFCYNDRVKVLS